MKRLSFVALATLVLGTLFFVGCSEEEQLDTFNSKKRERLDYKRDFALLIGKTIGTNSLQSEIFEEIEQIDSYGGGVSIAYLLGKEELIPENEKRQIEKEGYSGRISSFNFSELLVETYMGSPQEDFPSLSQVVDSNNPEMLIEILLGEDLEIYYPYKEEFDWGNITDFIITYDDGNSEESYEGFELNNLQTINEIDEINDDFIFENPSIAIIPINGDYIGEDLRIVNGNETYYLGPNLSFQELTDFYDDIYNNGGLNGNGNGNNNGSGSNNQPQRIRLTENINPYTFFGENDILTCYIPKVRITKRSWKRTLSKAHRTRIARAGSTVAVNPNGSFSAMTNTFYFDFNISASDLRKKRWKNVGIMFDPNWHKAKGSQQIIVWTKRSNAGNSSIQVKNEIKLDSEGNYTPSTSISHTFTSSSETKAIFRGNVELDRDQVLTTIINGSEYDNATYNHNGANLSVRRVASHFEFFFDFFYTEL